MKKIMDPGSRLSDEDLQTLAEDAEFLAQEAFRYSLRYGIDRQINYDHVVEAVQEVIDRRAQDK